MLDTEWVVWLDSIRYKHQMFYQDKVSGVCDTWMIKRIIWTECLTVIQLILNIFGLIIFILQNT